MNFFGHLEGYTTNRLALVKNIYQLFKLEAKLAGLNFLPLLVCLGLFITFLLSTWFVLMAFLGYLILPLCKNNPLIVLPILFIVNLSLVVFIGSKMATCLSRMSFSKTRAVLSEHEPNFEEVHEQTKRTTAVDKPIRKRNPARTTKSREP
ncbi:MAG: hypothetical protein LCH30_01315 [Proteobacteria bacterium]|nr:hypothetical protein [Pseudomonadota bacterium]